MNVREKVITQLWKMGNLDYKRNSDQLVFNEFIKRSPDNIIIGVQHRRLGKSHGLLLTGIEFCLSNENSIVNYICPREKMIKSILMPTMRQILKDCPSELRPEWKENDKVWRFSNGSELRCCGTDNGHAERLRGSTSNLCLIDEAGFCDELKYVVYSVLIPTILMSGGKIIMSSSLSLNEDHDFEGFISNNNSVIVQTIDDNLDFSDKIIKQLASNYQLGKADPSYKREYLCER